jgi:hypothetical protein
VANRKGRLLPPVVCPAFRTRDASVKGGRIVSLQPARLSEVKHVSSCSPVPCVVPEEGEARKHRSACEHERLAGNNLCLFVILFTERITVPARIAHHDRSRPRSTP